jgi:hypothetical protein
MLDLKERIAYITDMNTDKNPCISCMYFEGEPGQQQTSADWSDKWDGFCYRYPKEQVVRNADKKWCGEWKGA